jgi:hypothetical protein
MFKKMMMKKGILLFLFLISSIYSMGQGFVYSYDDPCTSKTNEIYIDNPNGNTALFYGGQTQTFTPAQLQSGAVQLWINQVNSTNPSGPCSGVGLAQNVTVNATIAVNNIAVLTNVLSTLSSITSVASSTMTSTVSSVGGSTIGGIVQADEKVNDNNNNSNENKDKSNNNTNGTTTTNNNGGNSTTTNGNTGTSQSGGNQNTSSGVGGSSNPQGGTTTTTNNPTSTGSQSSQSPVSTPVTSGNQTSGQSSGNQGNNSVSSNSPVTSGNNSTPNTNNSTTPNTNNSTGNSGGGGNLAGGANAVKADTNEKNEKQEQAKEDAQSSSAQSSSSTKSKVAAVKKGNVMMTGDIVTISSADGVDPTQVRVNASIIMSNTKNTFAKGALINFTSTVNNSNITLFMSFRKKKLTTIIANSSMMNFDKDFFNTTSVMESYQFGKITGTVGVNYTMGNLGDSKFQSLSTLGGVIGTFKINKNFGMTTMFVVVYSPYVFFYEGMWNQSGYIAVPFVAVDYKLTKKFKLNLSFSGVNQINDQTLNYQVLIGAKAFL